MLVACLTADAAALASRAGAPQVDLPAQAAGRPAESGVWASKKQLVEQIMYYIKGYNEAAAAFSWNYTGKPLTV